MKKQNKIIIAIAIQTIILLWICIQREIIIHTGDIVYIRTRPVDPRDLFRGDYVRLNYEISNLSTKLASTEEIKELYKKEKRAYLIYSKDSRNVLVPEKVLLSKPNDSPFIRAFTKKNWNRNNISLRYGIEKYFVQQGKGLVLERGQTLEGIRIPLEMKTIIGQKSGIAVIKGYRYCDMGISVTLPPFTRRNQDPSFKIKIKLINASNKKLAIVDPPNHSTFKLNISYSYQLPEQEKIHLKTPQQDPEDYSNSDIKILPPKTVYSFEIDLDTPEFQLIKGMKKVNWNEMGWKHRVSIIYTPPLKEEISNLNHKDKIWQGKLSTRTFSARSFVD